MLEKGGKDGGDSVGGGDDAKGYSSDLSLKEGQKIKIAIGSGSKVVGCCCVLRLLVVRCVVRWVVLCCVV